ncbi:hypothetical protein LTR78_005593 [Recurvomyces mirabilis]|uniref:Methyltransferase tdiE n=1 Tax=Recurvomyces mirabilis TaxID=574656 RepID=A0AAE0WML3_9PEZI|nr:hypothetical protein LTR78_005593 [Recurvomyces mirabilis]KAK5151286.1 hypothetical protein LTS14_009456 [Recurvomyces mirabilis]
MHDWPGFFKQVWDNLEPDGWLETSEVQFPCRRADQEDQKPSPFVQWGENVLQGTRKAGIDAAANEKFSDQLRAQGFIQIDRVDVQWPIKPWAKGDKNKYLGKLLYRNTLDAVPAIATGVFTRCLGWSKDQVDTFCKEVIEDVDDKESHFYYPMVLHLAQKPLDA